MNFFEPLPKEQEDTEKSSCTDKAVISKMETTDEEGHDYKITELGPLPTSPPRAINQGEVMKTEHNESTGVGILFGSLILAAGVFFASFNFPKSDFQYCQDRAPIHMDKCLSDLKKLVEEGIINLNQVDDMTTPYNFPEVKLEFDVCDGCSGNDCGNCFVKLLPDNKENLETKLEVRDE